MSDLADRRRQLIRQRDERAAVLNAASRTPLGQTNRERLREMGDEIAALDRELREVETLLDDERSRTPNTRHASVPPGPGNPVLRVWGEPTRFAFTPRPHYELGFIDFERAARMSGARFSVLTGQVARLERALAAFMLDIQTTEHGYTEVSPPFLVRAPALYGTGSLPKFEADLFRTGDLYLIPTAEVPLTNLHAHEIMTVLPAAYAAYTPCFRSEAGSAGRDVRGMIRQHQFGKVEIVRLTRPETAEEEHETLTRHAETVLERLGLHYRRVLLAADDMGFSAHKTYDLEVWLPSENAYREISSCSWFHDFQARRANIRYRPAPKEKPRFVHTLNGSALAVGRTIVAILENFQQADGSVLIPEALQDYARLKRLTPAG